MSVVVPISSFAGPRSMSDIPVVAFVVSAPSETFSIPFPVARKVSTFVVVFGRLASLSDEESLPYPASISDRSVVPGFCAYSFAFTVVWDTVVDDSLSPASVVVGICAARRGNRFLRSAIHR